MTFEDLITSPDRKFLNLFVPSFVCVNQQESVIRNEMSKIPTSASRLAQPGTQSKRPREGSLDLENGLTAKKSRSDTGPSTNLTKSKSKSMMSIAGGRFLETLGANCNCL